MRVEIDQSGRVEDLSSGTAVAFTNGCSGAIYITAGEKRIVTRYLKSKIVFFQNYAPLFFAALVCLLINRKPFGSILIDEEYTGKFSIIEKKIVGQFGASKVVNIAFGRIGKRSPAHNLAINTLRNKGRGAARISAKNVIRLFAIKQAGPRRRTHRVSR
jgi:hypothetical protein